MRDFTLDTYRALLVSLRDAGYVFITVEQYFSYVHTGTLEKAGPRCVVLRHDVDRCPESSLRIAQMEHGLGIRSSYYFRIVPCSNRPDVIRSIVALGHEIGYHYEDLSSARGNMAEAIVRFENNLAYLRTFYPVRTICMHGSPMSKWDGRDLWKEYDYKHFGIIGEPYLDIDYGRMFYLTDTGRCWDGYKVSVRDKIPMYHDLWVCRGLDYHSSYDIMAAAVAGRLPHSMMLTTHPQRWTGNVFGWLYELLCQSLKNAVKRMLFCRAAQYECES